MQKYKISKRLLALRDYASMLGSSINHIADIGTDHGYLPYACYQSEMITHSILCDVNQGPLENAMHTFNNTLYESSVSFRLGSGLEPIEPNEVDLVFIAGMGGGLIRDILAKDISKSLSFSYLILQPMTEQSELRKWLLESGFILLWDGFMQEAGKHYEVLVVASVPVFSPEVIDIPSSDLEFGVRILSKEKPLYSNFLRMKQNKYEAIRNQIQNHNSDNSTLVKIQLCQLKLQTIDHIREALGL